MPSSADSASAAWPPEPVPVRLPITLGQFLKVAGMVSTGGEAKYLITSGEVAVNDELETRRGRHLKVGDSVGVGGETVVVIEDHTEDHTADHTYEV